MTFSEYLQRQGVAPNTIRVYLNFYSQVGDSDPVDFLERQIAERPPAGTLSPLRAAIGHLLRWKGETARADALPRSRGRRGRLRRSLDAEELRAYLEAVDALPEGPVRDVLRILPKTGLRISEACGLKATDLEEKGKTLILRLIGKGNKERVVPVIDARAVALLLQRKKLDTIYIFPGRLPDTHLTANAVRKVTGRMAIKNLSPHVLRHTYATSLLEKGADLKSVQTLLGHENIATTGKYLHPSTEKLTSVVAALEDDGGEKL